MMSQVLSIFSDISDISFPAPKIITPKIVSHQAYSAPPVQARSKKLYNMFSTTWLKSSYLHPGRLTWNLKITKL